MPTTQYADCLLGNIRELADGSSLCPCYKVYRIMESWECVRISVDGATR